MAAAVDFYFDFYSPYGYLASRRIDEIAARHGREVNWRPFLLGPVFKAMGLPPMLQTPLIGDYVKLDFVRSARLAGVKIRFPEEYPKVALAPARAFYWLHDRNPAQAKALAKSVYQAIFAEGRDGNDPGLLARLAQAQGIDAAQLLEAIQTPGIKDRLKQEVNRAVEQGVCGSPFFIVDGEPFWGNDRLDQVDLWLEKGGW